MSWRSLGLVLLWLFSVQGSGGTGAGNEYEHFIKPDFDFHLAMPPSWECHGCDDPVVRSHGSEIQQSWMLEAPERTTWLSVDFITGFPAQNKDDLLSEIRARHPDVEWHDIQRGGFEVGFSSSPQDEFANAAIEYYLVDHGQVIRIEWQKDRSNPARAYELDNIKRSIDRASAPPKVIDIRTEKDAYRVGDEACYLIEVDDLTAGFDKASLRRFEIAGAPSHWSFKKVEWIGKSSWFRVCFKVTSAFDKDGLAIVGFGIESDSRSIACAPSLVPTSLECRNGDFSGDAYVVQAKIGKVENHAPDRNGPEILDLTFDEKTLRLDLAVRDPSGFGVGRIDGTWGSLYVYPDQLEGETEISLSGVAHGGWNTLKSIVLFDGNGMPTLLRVPEGKTPGRSGTTYELVRSDGTIERTDIPVVTFLHARVR